MVKKKYLLVKLMILFFGRSSALYCDMDSTTVREGILGQTSDFPWLGVLEVHIRDFDKRHVAVSGIVLIKVRYALANADDVVRIPERVLKSDTLAVFIAAEDTPFAMSPLSYAVHPEYGDSTINSLAVIELKVDNLEEFPLTPVCLPIDYFKNTKYLYLTGFTDENKALEKAIYQIQNLNIRVCDEYYERAGILDNSTIPSSYVCGYAPYSSIHCLWDDGMALVSNATGWFVMVGLSFHGPGCTAPARFIELFPYLSWIQFITGSDNANYATPHPRRRNEIEFIPVHELFTANNTRRKGVEIEILGHEYVKFGTGKLDHFTITPAEKDNHTLAIYPFNEMHEQFENACKTIRVLMYRENFQLKTENEVGGDVTYKLSLYDLKYMVCICVELSVNCINRTKATLSFREEIDFASGTDDAASSAADMYKFIPYAERTEKPKKETPHWLNRVHFKPTFIKNQYRTGTVLSYDLYIRFKFTGVAVLKFKMFASLITPTNTELRTIPETTTTGPTSTPTAETTTTESTTTESGRRRYPGSGDDFYWGMNRPDRMYREESDTLVADDEVVHETVSEGSRSARAPVLVALGCLLITVSLRTTLIIQ